MGRSHEYMFSFRMLYLGLLFQRTESQNARIFSAHLREELRSKDEVLAFVESMIERWILVTFSVPVSKEPIVRFPMSSSFPSTTMFAFVEDVSPRGNGTGVSSPSNKVSSTSPKTSFPVPSIPNAVPNLHSSSCPWLHKLENQPGHPFLEPLELTNTGHPVIQRKRCEEYAQKITDSNSSDAIMTPDWRINIRRKESSECLMLNAQPSDRYRISMDTDLLRLKATTESNGACEVQFLTRLTRLVSIRILDSWMSNWLAWGDEETRPCAGCLYQNERSRVGVDYQRQILCLSNIERSIPKFLSSCMGFSPQKSKRYCYSFIPSIVLGDCFGGDEAYSQCGKKREVQRHDTRREPDTRRWELRWQLSRR